MHDYTMDIGDLAAMLHSLLAIGRVSSVDDAAGTCRVVLLDADNMESYDLRVLQAKTHKDKQYIMPDVGEMVLCTFLPSGNEQGFVLGAYYSATDPVPVETRDKWHVRFKDGATIEYDRKEHVLSAFIPGDATIKTTGNISATVGGDLSTTVTGNISAKADGTIRAKAAGAISATSDASITLTAPSITLNGKTAINGPLTQGGGSNGGNASFKGKLHTTDTMSTNADVVAQVSLNSHTHGCKDGGTGAPNG